MIGVESPSNGKLFYNFNLEKKVRKDHLLRKLKEILNLDLGNSPSRPDPHSPFIP